MGALAPMDTRRDSEGGWEVRGACILGALAAVDSLWLDAKCGESELKGSRWKPI